MVQYNTIQYSTMQYSTVQYSTLQYSTVQYSTVQYSTCQAMELEQWKKVSEKGEEGITGEQGQGIFVERGRQAEQTEHTKR